MSTFVYRDNVNDYLKSTINEEFASLTPEQMLSTLTDGVASLPSNPSEIRKIYLSRDVTDVRNYLISLIEGLTDEWTDYNESDIGVALIELMSGLADMLGFYLDRQTLECYIGSVKQRKNGAALLQLINYRLHMMHTCSTTGRFTLMTSYDQDLLIPKFTQVSATLSDGSKIYYATSEDLVIYAGNTQGDVALLQGEVHHSNPKVGDLRNNQKVKINTDNIAADTMVINIDGMEWTRVDDVLVDDVPGPKYSVYEDKECKAYILFHNNYKDYLPADDSILAEIKFIVTLGAEGKIKDGAISKIETGIYLDGSDITNEIEVTNIDSASGGSDRETLDEARLQAPKTLSMLDRVVTLSDFEDKATEIPGILRSRALDWRVAPELIPAPFLIKLYVVPTDGYDLSQAQKDEIISIFNKKMVSYQQVEVLEPEYVYLDLDVVAEAYVTSANTDYLANRIKSQLEEAYKPKNLQFSESIYISDIKSVVRSTSEDIFSVDITNMTEDIHLGINQFLRVGDIHVTVISRRTNR